MSNLKISPLSNDNVWEQLDNVLHLLGIHCGMPQGVGEAHITTGFEPLAKLLEGVNPKTRDQKELEQFTDKDGGVWQIHRHWFVKRPWFGWFGRVIIAKNINTGRYRKVFIPHRPSIRRFEAMTSTFAMRSNYSSVKAEQQAQLRLCEALSEQQRDCYFLNDAFIELGRSGLFYVLRRNRPTLAVRPNKDGSERPLCALCLHPTGYYMDTWAGIMPPSDEVLAHLLMIRASEKFYWRKANHIPLDEETSGV